MMNKEKYNEIIDEVYDKYTTKYVGYDDVPSKELFLFEQFLKQYGINKSMSKFIEFTHFISYK